MLTLQRILGILLGIILPLNLFPLNYDDDDPGRFNFTSGQSKVEIPFYTFNNQVILAVTVNDKVPLNFILDSGTAQAIFFDRKLAQELGIGFGRRIQFSGVGNHNNVTAFRGRGVKLNLPGIEGHMMGMAILGTDYMDMKRFDIHGIIGYQLFARFAVKIDYGNRMLTLMEPNKYNVTGYHGFDIQIENSKPYLKSFICLENNPDILLKLMIDTGAAFGLSLINGTHPAIKPPDKTAKIRIGSGLGGEFKGFKGTAIVKLSKEITSKVVAYYVDLKDFSKKDVDPGKMGSIGGDLLKNYIVIIDYVNSRILFQQNTVYLTDKERT